jgi:hypothetical protein
MVFGERLSARSYAAPASTGMRQTIPRSRLGYLTRGQRAPARTGCVCRHRGLKTFLLVRAVYTQALKRSCSSAVFTRLRSGAVPGGNAAQHGRSRRTISSLSQATQKAKMSMAVEKGAIMAAKWYLAAGLSKPGPFALLSSVLQNGPEVSRARRCWARRSEPLTPRTVLRRLQDGERPGEVLAKIGPP